MTQDAYVIARFMMKFDAMERPVGQDNLKKVSNCFLLSSSRATY